MLNTDNDALAELFDPDMLIYQFARIRAKRADSNDPTTKTAAGLLGWEGELLGVASNFIDYPGDVRVLDREQRLALSEHAETRVVRPLGLFVPGLATTVLTIGTPCEPCMRAMADQGILAVVIDHDKDPFKDRLNEPRYEFDKAFALAEERGMSVFRLSLEAI